MRPNTTTCLRNSTATPHKVAAPYRISVQLRVSAPGPHRRLPLRVFAYQRVSGSGMNTDYLNWQRGLPILNAFFIPEPGVDIATLSYEEYIQKQAHRQPLGPVPVLYSDLLHGF